ncbi:uncharacterized protein LOC144107621 isoform X2 [Amblyomma americanum]
MNPDNQGPGHSWRPRCIVCGLGWAANAVLHPLPSAKKREHQAWIDFVRRSPGRGMHDWTPSNCKPVYVCSLHFAASCICPMKMKERCGTVVYERRLRPGAVPTIYPKAANADARGVASAVPVAPLVLGERGIDVGPSIKGDDQKKKLPRGAFNVEEEAYLIDLVKERPLLWNRDDAQYFDQELKGVAYGQIASAFRGKFTVAQLREKFRILRNQFREEKRKLKSLSEARPGITPESHWVHYKRIMFMDIINGPRRWRCKLVKKENQEQDPADVPEAAVAAARALPAGLPQDGASARDMGQAPEPGSQHS